MTFDYLWRVVPSRFLSFPYEGFLIVEPTNVCNITCTLCPVWTNKMKRPRGYMQYENFKTIVDEIYSHRTSLSFRPTQINFTLAGEPTLHPDIWRMVKYASEHGLVTNLYTNGTMLNDQVADLLSSGLDFLLVALDGARAETHEAYRVGSSFRAVTEGIMAVVKERKKRGLTRPEVTAQCLVTKKNEHELSDVQSLACKLEADRLVFKTINLGDWTLTNSERKLAADEWLPRQSRWRRFDADLQIKGKPSAWCEFVRHSMIFWNGDVTICCYDYCSGDYVMGNIFEEGGLRKIWEGKKYRTVRRKILRREYPICKSCYTSASYYESLKLPTN